MKWCFRKVILRPESGVAVHKTRASSQFTPTLDYLPGSTVRGAYAQLFINKRSVKDEAFQQIFVEEKVRFSDFLPSNIENSTHPPVLLPMSASACKREKLKHLDSLRDRLISQYSASRDSHKEQDKCPIEDCGEPLDRMEGKYLQSLEKPEPEAVEYSKQLRMHVGISRATGSTIHALLFSHQLLSKKIKWVRENGILELAQKDLFFVGTLAAPESEAEALFAAIDQVVSQREHLSIGASKTRGLGEFVIQRMEINNDNHHADDFEARWKAFNVKFAGKADSAEKCFFSLTLLSNLALRDKMGKPVLDEIQPKHLNLPQECKLEAAFLNRTIVSGWNAAQGLPKPDTVALARGSVLLLSAPKQVEQTHLKEKLMQLEHEGFGERRAEGFGAIAVCHPFHTNFAKE